ncbi:MAG: hypothetical protein ACYDCC_14940 [Actinomycetota bacterium]
MSIVAFQLLEWSFITLLAGMLGLAGIIGLIVVVRLVEPRGLKAFLQRFSGKSASR